MSIANSGPSSGGNLAKLTKRVADLERKLSKFSEQRVLVRDSFGKGKKLVVIAKRQGADDLPSGAAPFSLSTLKKKGSGYAITISVGWLRDLLTIKKGGIKFYMPKVGGVSLDSDPAPEITMNVADKLYCKYATDPTGTVTGDATIITSKKEEETKHYQPKDASGKGGENGEYWVKLGELVKGSGQSVIWKQYQNSDIEHVHEIPTFKNLGDGAGVMKRHNADTGEDEARKIKGLYGIDQTEEDDRVTLDVIVENVGDGNPLIVVPEKGSNQGSDESMKVRTIRAAKAEDLSGSNTPQIKVEKNDNVLVVKGNGKSGSLVLSDCDGKEVLRLEWSDGLITTDGNLNATLGDCDNRGSGSDTPPPP